MSAPRAEGDDDGGVSMRQLMSAVTQVLAQNRAMHEEMKGMRAVNRATNDEMKLLRAEMEGMKDTMNEMEESLRTMQDDNDSRFGTIERGQKYQEWLLKNQKWKYSASVPPSGSIDDESRSLIKEIKKKTCDMRHGQNEVGNVGIIGHFDPTRHRPSFTGHWREFSSALQNYGDALECLPKKESSRFEIRGVQLPNDVVSMLRHGLHHTHFHQISFWINNFDREGLGMVLDIIQNNPILEKFALRLNPFQSLDDLNKLSRIVTEHPTISAICFEYYPDNGIDGHTVLCSLMEAGKSKLKSIEMNFSSISTGGSTLLDPILESLDLDGNNLVDADVINIANALKRNTNLRELGISAIDAISSEGKGSKALRETEFDPTSLNSAADSNHTCFAPGFNVVNGTCYGFYANPVAARRLKIYHLLSARNMKCENTRHFEDIPVEFLPDMLDAIHRYSDNDVWDDRDAPDTFDYEEHMMTALSIVYEVMRRWDKVFSLFKQMYEQKLLKR